MNLTKLAQAGDLGTFTPPTDAYSKDSASTNTLFNLESFITNMLGLLTTVASLVFIAYFLYGSLRWVMAGGDSGKVQKARDQMVQGAMGLLVVVMAYSLIGLVGTMFGLDLLHPGAVLKSLIPTP